jgi:hypothetical protein
MDNKLLALRQSPFAGLNSMRLHIVLYCEIRKSHNINRSVSLPSYIAQRWIRFYEAHPPYCILRPGEGPGVSVLSWLNYFTQYIYEQVFHWSICRVL